MVAQVLYLMKVKPDFKTIAIVNLVTPGTIAIRVTSSSHAEEMPT